jgi:hypothetical protein
MRKLYQQLFNVIFIEMFNESFLGGDDAVAPKLLFLLQHMNFFFDAVAGNEFVTEHGFCLPNSVTSVNGLLFHRGIPPGISQENIIGFS